jgi:hypothetical protein
MSINPSLTTLSGLATDRPTAPTFTGLIYFATDTGAVSAWDGTLWQPVSGEQATAVELSWLRLKVYRMSLALQLIGINPDDLPVGP